MKYPNNIQKKNTQNISYGNRGMDLEESINIANEYYIEKDLALIYKKPTPIGIVDVTYENQKKIIKKAYFKEPSTLDYNGLYKGRYIEFEAKETKNKTSFPLANIHKHQIKHLKSVILHKGIAFLIIRINSLNYILKGEDFLKYIENKNRKSVEYKYIQEKGYLVKESFNGLEYLDVIDKIYFGGNL